MALKTTGDWELRSGTWAIDSSESGLAYRRSASGIALAESVSRDDLGILMQARRSTRDPSLHFPPEFKFCPTSGESLMPVVTPALADAWIAPFGGLPVNGIARQSGASGLRQTAKELVLAKVPADYREDGMSEYTMPSPPPGDYEFFSAPFGTVDMALICVDARKGVICAWLPASGYWVELQEREDLLLDRTLLPPMSWRAELACCFDSRLYLPTEHGLACVTPDVLSLTYGVQYLSAGPSLAAPIAFDGKVWSPVLSGSRIELVSVEAGGGEGPAVTAEMTGPPGAPGAPVSYKRLAVWPFENGQLRLQKQPSGSVSATWIDWPADIRPVFGFGCPYLSRAGELWQLCFNGVTEEYLYLRLGSEEVEQAPVGAPRFCSGTVNYRFAAKMKDDPWVEPESGDDTSNRFVIPLLETPAGNVVGLKIESNTGLEEVLQSDQRTRAVLVFEDRTSQLAFHTISVTHPWRTRIFCHQGVLWVYHAELSKKPIDGWALQS